MSSRTNPARAGPPERTRGVPTAAALGRFDRQGLTPEVLARLAPEWASLPTLAGDSHYGQPVKRRTELQRFYQRELERQRRLTSA